MDPTKFGRKLRTMDGVIHFIETRLNSFTCYSVSILIDAIK